jgi:hypothetical protein
MKAPALPGLGLDLNEEYLKANLAPDRDCRITP